MYCRYVYIYRLWVLWMWTNPCICPYAPGRPYLPPLPTHLLTSQSPPPPKQLYLEEATAAAKQKPLAAGATVAALLLSIVYLFGSLRGGSVEETEEAAPAKTVGDENDEEEEEEENEDEDEEEDEDEDEGKPRRRSARKKAD